MTDGKSSTFKSDLMARWDAAGEPPYEDIMALVSVAEVAQKLVSNPPYHNCRGPFCPLCIELPDRLAALRADQ